MAAASAAANLADRFNLSSLISDCTGVVGDYFNAAAPAVVAGAQANYNRWMSLADPRVSDWPLMSSPLPTAAILAAYLCLCFAGPAAMRSHKPVAGGIRVTLAVYNLGAVAINGYVGAVLLWAVFARDQDFSWGCEPVDYSDDPVALRIAGALWWYYVSKLYELLDTVFFVLRKKSDQLTFLHVYHHSTMFGLWWIGVKFVAGGSSFPGAMLNSFVHVAMYGYYFLAALGPRFQPWLWWKKYLTLVQLAQFCAALFFGVKAVAFEASCDFPLWMQYTLIFYMMSFIALFSDFFRKEYSRKRSVHSPRTNGCSNGNKKLH